MSDLRRTEESQVSVSGDDSHTGKVLLLPDRAVTVQQPIKNFDTYGQRVLVRFQTPDPSMDFLAACPLTIAGFRAAFPTAESPSMKGYAGASVRIALVHDDLKALISPTGDVIHVLDNNFLFEALPDGILILLPRVLEEPRNLYFYEFDGTLRWRVQKNPWKQSRRFVSTEISSDGRIFGMLDWHIGDIFEIDRMTGEIIGHEHDPARCPY